jgi:hypothetical protein
MPDELLRSFSDEVIEALARYGIPTDVVAELTSHPEDAATFTVTDGERDYEITIKPY